MKRKRQILCFIVIAVITVVFSGCKEKNRQNIASDIININPHQAQEYMNLSEIADSIEVIKLQTEPGDILGLIREIIIKDKYIYVVDKSQQAIFLFDKSGRFVSKLARQGRGPGEYILMKPVFVDDKEEFIEFINFMGDKTPLYRYSLPDFEFIGEYPALCPMRITSCKRTDSVYYYATQQLDNVVDDKRTNAGLLIVKDGKIVKTLFDKVIKTQRSVFFPYSECFAVNDSNEIFMSLMYDNSFYKICDEDASAVFTVDFGKHGMSGSIGARPLEKQMEYIKSANRVAMFPVLNINNSDIMSFSYYFKEGAEERFFRKEDVRYYIRYKDKTYHAKRIKNDLTDFPAYIYLNSSFPSCVHQVYYKNYLVDVIIPSSMIDFPEDGPDKIFVEGLGEITSDDNPIVVMMRMKE